MTSPERAPTPPWVLHVERREKTTAVARCQVAPFSFSSVMAVEATLVAADRVVFRVVRDDEHATGVTALPSLLGKGYVALKGPGALRVVDAADHEVEPAEARRMQSLATAALAWPGASVAGGGLATGAEATSLERAVARIADAPLHGAEVPAAQEKAIVRLRAATDTEAVFDVTVEATAEDAGMCHHWASRADLKGELRVRVRDGALLAMHLEGTTGDTEGLCQAPSGKPGPPPPPRACNRGTIDVDVKQPDVP
jgi:hypothetical protein